MSFDILFSKNFKCQTVGLSRWITHGSLSEEWVQNCDRLRYAVSFYRGEHEHEVSQELQERLAVLERNPPDLATATHVQVEDPGSGNGC